jgi:hypothetical protein
VVQFAIVVAVSAAMIDVLGPLVAHASLGGASAWGFLLTAYAVGAVTGRYRRTSCRVSRRTTPWAGTR